MLSSTVEVVQALGRGRRWQVYQNSGKVAPNNAIGGLLMKGFIIFWLASVAVTFAFMAAFIYVVLHFVGKFW